MYIVYTHSFSDLLERIDMKQPLIKILRNVGIKIQTDFYNPRVEEFDKLSFPKNTMFHNRVGIPSMSDPVISHLTRPVGYIAEEITKQSLTPYRKSNITVNKLYSNYIDIGSGIEYYRKPNRLLSVPTTRDVIIDYSALQLLYRYSPNKNKPLSELQDPYRTIIESVNESRYGSRIDFISLPLPTVFPTYNDVLKALKYDDYKLLRYIDESFYPHYEILKYLFSQYRQASVYNVINDYRINPLYIIVHGNSGFTILEINKLFAMSKETDIAIHGFDKRDPKMLVKYYLGYLVNILLKTTPDIAKDIVNTDKNSGITDTEHVVDRIDEVVAVINGKNETIEVATKQETVESVIGRDENPLLVSKETLSILKESGLGNPKRFEEYEKELADTLNEYENLALTEEERKIKPDKLPLDVTVDEELTKEVSTTSKRKYIEKYLDRHLKQSILAISKAGIPITGIEEVKEDTLSNRKKTLKIFVKQPVGNPVTLPLHIPLPDKDGVYRVNGTEYKMIRQRTDAPIKKTKPTEVVLSSFYGKLFLRRAELSSTDSSIYISKKLSKMAEDPEIGLSMYVIGKNTIYDVKLPTEYETISRNTRSFLYGEVMFLFSYHERNILIHDSAKLEKIEKHGALVGSDDRLYYVINMDNHLLSVDGNGKIVEDYGDFYSYLGLTDVPYEYITTKIKGVRLPIVAILMYYIKFSSLLKRLDIKYDFKEKRNELTENDITFRFLDGYFGVNKNNIYASLIVGSLKMYEKTLKEINYRMLDNRDTVKDMLSLSGVDLRVVNAFIPLRAMFIDPITKEALIDMKEPTDFIALLIRGCELLKDDYLRNPNHISTFVIRSDDRLAGMVYNILSRSVSQYYDKLGRVRTKLTVDPYSVYKALSADATFSLKEDLNPVEAIRQDDELTMMGMFGRSRDTITNKDRVFDPSMVGVISEATKDNQNVGVVNYLSAVPNITTYSGILKEANNIKPANIYSLSGLLAPDITRDDGKRMLYTTIQNKHIVATNGAIVPPYRTEAESVIPYRVDSRYALHADRSGVVKKVNKTSITISYSGKDETYKFKEWLGKDTGGKTYKHTQKTLLRVGDKVEPGDNIYYDSLYFGEDVFNRKRVAYKTGVLTLVAQTEAEDSFEDASNISKHLADKMVTPVTYIRDKILPMNINLETFIGIGDKVVYNDNLLTYRTVEDVDTSKLTEFGREVLEDISSNTIKAETKGTVIAIEIYYNLPDDNTPYSVSDSVMEILSKTDKYMQEQYGKNGEIDNTFSVKGKGIQPGFMYVKFFIEKQLPIGPTDKYRLGNQLKTTVANVFEKIVTESGREIGVEFGKRGIEARIVDSPYIQGTVNMILDKIEQNFLADLGI